MAASFRLADGTEIEFTTDEAEVPAYELPDPLTRRDGGEVRDPSGWRERREEILELFRAHVYGSGPPAASTLALECVRSEASETALGGIARRRQLRVYPFGAGGGVSFDLLLYLPHARQPAPVFLGLNFGGNHTLHADPEIRLSERWVPHVPDEGVESNRATEKARGTRAGRWPVESIVERGFGLASVYSGDLEPDFPGGATLGVRSKLEEPGARDDAWGAVGVWAWGLSCALDALAREPDVDAERICVLGHSRLGKAALWAGAQDERFALVLSNDSGCAGAALSRRRFGENVRAITTLFPHWFCARFAGYGDAEHRLPVDQHQLLALVAPRPLYVASAADDLWADPRGEFLAARAADPVFRLLTGDGLPVEEMPPVDTPVAGRIAYHVRSGGHDLTRYDWLRVLEFAERQLG